MKKDWKYYTGIVCFVWSFAAYGILAGVTASSLTAATKALTAGILIASAEIAFFLSILLLGKTFVMAMKDKLKQWFGFGKKAEENEEKQETISTGISRFRHYTGVTLLFLSFIPPIAAEILLITRHTADSQINLVTGLLISGDVIFVVGLFVLGPDFWEKLKQLFTWQGNN